MALLQSVRRSAALLALTLCGASTSAPAAVAPSNVVELHVAVSQPSVHSSDELTIKLWMVNKTAASFEVPHETAYELVTLRLMREGSVVPTSTYPLRAGWGNYLPPFHIAPGATLVLKQPLPTSEGPGVWIPLNRFGFGKPLPPGHYVLNAYVVPSVPDSQAFVSYSAEFDVVP